MSDRYDVFVGNLTFNTTEEQLKEKFSVVGPIKNIRILVDKETSKPKGFAFIEYYDANTALSAIKHLDQIEMNSRKLKVGYPANSNLKDIARQIGQTVDGPGDDRGSGPIAGEGSRHQMEQNVIANLKLSEAWDVLEAVKKLVSGKDQKAKTLLEQHPQLVNAVYDIQKRLGIQLPEKIVQQQQQAAIAAASANIAAFSKQQQTNQSQQQSLRAPSAQHSRDYHQDPYQGRTNSDNNNRGGGGGGGGGSGSGGYGNQQQQQQSYNDSGSSGRRSRFSNQNDQQQNYNNSGGNNGRGGSNPFLAGSNSNNYDDYYDNRGNYNDNYNSNSNDNYRGGGIGGNNNYDNYYDQQDWERPYNTNNNSGVNNGGYYDQRGGNSGGGGGNDMVINDLAIDALLNQI